MGFLYKFRPSEPLGHLVDILLEMRLYCAPYNELNDPFEGQFIEELINISHPMALIYMLTKGMPLSYSQVDRTMNIKKSVQDLSASKTDLPRICSLTSSHSDVRMWSLYASGHNGVAFELNFDGCDIKTHEVIYEPTLKKWSTGPLTVPSHEEVLTRKTEHWRYEQEYRIFTKEEYVSVANRIRRVILGARATPMLETLVRRLVGHNIEVVKASLDFDGVRV